MPHLQFDINKKLSKDSKKHFINFVEESFSKIMETGKDHIAISIREFEKDNHPTIGEKLSETIDDIVNLQRLRKRHLFEYDWNKRDCELEDDFNEPLHYFTKEIKENRMKVLDVIMD